MTTPIVPAMKPSASPEREHEALRQIILDATDDTYHGWSAYDVASKILAAGFHRDPAPVKGATRLWHALYDAFRAEGVETNDAARLTYVACAVLSPAPADKAPSETERRG